jgi:thioredoxin-related protein
MMHKQKIKKKSRKIIIDVYTDWCGWCKKLDASTYKNKEIVRYTNEKYYAIKFNAEGKEAVKFNGTNYSATAGTHKLASYLLSNKLSYPTTVIVDEDLSVIQAIPGYMDAKTMEMVLHYFAEDAHKTIPWDEYQKTFSGEVK